MSEWVLLGIGVWTEAIWRGYVRVDGRRHRKDTVTNDDT